MDFKPDFQLILTAAGAVGAIAFIIVAFRSRVPAETIRIQEENIRALQEAHKTNNERIKSLESQVSRLEAENNVLRTIPLQSLESTQQKILSLLTTQNQILNKLTSGQSTIINT